MPVTFSFARPFRAVPLAAAPVNRPNILAASIMFDGDFTGRVATLNLQTVGSQNQGLANVFAVKLDNTSNAVGFRIKAVDSGDFIVVNPFEFGCFTISSQTCSFLVEVLGPVIGDTLATNKYVLSAVFFDTPQQTFNSKGQYTNPRVSAGGFGVADLTSGAFFPMSKLDYVSRVKVNMDNIIVNARTFIVASVYLSFKEGASYELLTVRAFDFSPGPAYNVEMCDFTFDPPYKMVYGSSVSLFLSAYDKAKYDAGIIDYTVTGLAA